MRNVLIVVSIAVTGASASAQPADRPPADDDRVLLEPGVSPRQRVVVRDASQQPVPSTAQEPVGERPRVQLPIEGVETERVVDPYVPIASGLEVSIGAGLSGFTDGALDDAVHAPAGSWSARLSWRTHRWLGAELGYSGSAVSIDTLGIRDATLIGTGVDAVGRWTILPDAPLAPFVFAGLGYQRFDTTSSDLSTADSGLDNSDSGLAVPMGAGLAYRFGRIVLDVRGTFRPVVNADVAVTDGSASMHAWLAGASFGYRL